MALTQGQQVYRLETLDPTPDAFERPDDRLLVAVPLRIVSADRHQ